jgi:hypothetical protein
MELLESVFKIDKSLLYYLPFSKINWNIKYRRNALYLERKILFYR